MTLRRGPASLVCLGGLLAAGAVGCGSGERQDANEVEATYELRVAHEEFPKRQRLGQSSALEIKLVNTGDEVVPNTAVTIDGFYRRMDDRDLADPNRPVFVLNGRPVEIGGLPDVKVAAPIGGSTSLVNTWALGEMPPGGPETFRWEVTAVKPGPYEITYSVAGGLQGKAKVVDANGDPIRGKFTGTITSRPPASRIAADGHTVINPAP